MELVLNFCISDNKQKVLKDIWQVQHSETISLQHLEHG